MGTCRGTESGGTGPPRHLHPLDWQSCPGLQERRCGRWRAGARSSPPALRPPPLTGRSPVAPSLRGPQRACGSRRTLGSRARRRGRARAVSAVRGEGWEFFWQASLVSCPLQTPGTELSSPMCGVLCPCPPRAKINADAKAQLHRPALAAGLVGRVQGLPAPSRCAVQGRFFPNSVESGVLPGSPGRWHFHLAVSLVWCSDCW